jgi:spore maturation protein CgeB
MKILYVGLLYNYGNQSEGYSYEHYNLEAGLKDCRDRGLFQVDFLYPDHEAGSLYRRANELVLSGGYDAIFHVAFNESLDFPESAAKLALKKDIPVVQWDCDASWRFATWIAQRKNRVSHFITTHAKTVPWYEKNGMNVIKSQWGGSPLYRRDENAVKKYDVTFVGQKHGQYNTPEGMRFVRAEIIDALMCAGINVDLFGHYWDGYKNWHGYVTNFHDMVQVFNESKICLNLSNPWHVGTLPQIKGRHFEIPQTGGFQLCTPADDLKSYFVPDDEIVIVDTVEDMVGRIQYFLEHDKERQDIAAAGYARMLQEHQWDKRFENIFKEVGVL